MTRSEGGAMKLTQNQRAFAAVYGDKLDVAIRKDPDGYMDTPESARETLLAERMTLSMTRGGANLSNTMRAAARALGIKPTIKGIREFLNQGGDR